METKTQRLGNVQKRVLLILSDGVARSATDWGAWWPLRAEQVRPAIHGLEMRGLVDVAGFEGRARTYCLTRAGYAVADEYVSTAQPIESGEVMP